MLMFINSKKFNPQGQQGWSIKKLNQWRNKFIHFIPGGWSLEVSGLPQIIGDCITVIEFLVFESKNILMEDKLMDNIRELLQNIKIEVDKLEALYNF